MGDRADLLFGTHGQFSTAGAIRLGQALEPYAPLWFEEPIPPDDIPAMARVAAQVRIPVATGERLTTASEFTAVLRAGAPGDALDADLEAAVGDGSRPARPRGCWQRDPPRA